MNRIFLHSAIIYGLNSLFAIRTGVFRHGMYLAEMTGPGRVGIQSMYHHHASE